MQKLKIKQICITAMMIALSIIIERLIIPTFQGQPFRIDFGNIPIIACSIVCGPFFGAVCGGVADMLGCQLNGYAAFLPLTLSPVIIGFFSGVAAKLRKKSLIFFASLIATYIAAEILWTPFGLYLLKGTSYAVEFSLNFPAALLQTIVDPILIYALLKSRILERTHLL